MAIKVMAATGSEPSERGHYYSGLLQLIKGKRWRYADLPGDPLRA